MSEEQLSINSSESALQKIQLFNYENLDPEALGGIIEAMIAIMEKNQDALNRPKNDCLSEDVDISPMDCLSTIAMNTAELAYDALMKQFAGDKAPTTNISTIEAIIRFQANRGLWTSENEICYVNAAQSIWRRDQMENIANNSVLK